MSASKDRPDVYGRTEEQIEADVELGAAIATEGLLTILRAVEGHRPPVLFNALGIIVSQSFAVLPFDSHENRMTEFDNWVAYTRGYLVATGE